MSICASVIQFKLIPRLMRLSPFCNGEPAVFYSLGNVHYLSQFKRWMGHPSNRKSCFWHNFGFALHQTGSVATIYRRNSMTLWNSELPLSSVAQESCSLTLHYIYIVAEWRLVVSGKYNRVHHSTLPVYNLVFYTHFNKVQSFFLSL